MILPGLLAGFPLLAAIIVFFLKGEREQNVVVKLSSAITIVLSLAVTAVYFGHPGLLPFMGAGMTHFMLAIDMVTAAAILYFTIIKYISRNSFNFTTRNPNKCRSTIYYYHVLK